MQAFEPRSILCGIDFSPASQAALACTALLAQAYQARVQVLHSHHVELPAYLTEAQWDALQRELDAARAAVETHMREAAAERLSGLAVPVEYAAVDSPPVDGLLEAISSHRFDLVVLGSHGRSRLNRFLLGSVSAGVLRETTVPLLVARQPQPGPAQVKHILCPVNYTPTAQAGLRAASSLAERLGVQLTLLHSLETGGDTEAERARLCEWAPAQIKAACTFDTAPVVKGPAADRIVQTAVDLGVDLIVVGGRSRPFLTASILGATTERVVRYAPCSVLTIIAP